MDVGGEVGQQYFDDKSSRRALLKRIAIAGAAGAMAPTIVSSPAFADSGTVKCRFSYTAPATFVATINRPGNNLARFQIITVTNPTGICPCGGTPTYLYSYWASLTATSSVTLNSGGWTAASTVSSGNVTIGGALGPFSYSMEVAIRVQCQGKGATPAFLCRFGVSSGSGASSYNVLPVAISSTTPTQLTGLAC